MTEEEALNLKPGDVISCAGNSHRIIVESYVSGSYLYWKQQDGGIHLDHSWPLQTVNLVRKADTPIVNNYQIY